MRYKVSQKKWDLLLDWAKIIICSQIKPLFWYMACMCNTRSHEKFQVSRLNILTRRPHFMSSIKVSLYLAFSYWRSCFFTYFATKMIVIAFCFSKNKSLKSFVLDYLYIIEVKFFSEPVSTKVIKSSCSLDLINDMGRRLSW